jgi:hypothetical protein
MSRCGVGCFLLPRRTLPDRWHQPTAKRWHGSLCRQSSGRPRLLQYKVPRTLEVTRLNMHTWALAKITMCHAVAVPRAA